MNNIPVNCYGVAGVVLKRFNGEYKVLLLKRAETPSGTWCYVAGKIESGEKAWEAVVREIKEETGLVPCEIYSGDICEQFYEIRKDSIWIAPVFVAYVTDEQRVTLNEEHSKYRWVSPKEAVEMFSFAGQRKIIDHIEKEFIDNEPTEWLHIKEYKRDYIHNASLNKV